MLTAQALREIEERAEKATPWPWAPTYKTSGYLLCIDNLCAAPVFDAQEYAGTSWIDANKDDVDFTCHARTDIPALLADRKALVEVIRALQWKSIDRDNMEFECRVTCYEMDVIRAIIQEDR